MGLHYLNHSNHNKAVSGCLHLKYYVKTLQKDNEVMLKYSSFGLTHLTLQTVEQQTQNCQY